MDAYFTLLRDLLAVECEVRPVVMILKRIKDLLTVEFTQRPVPTGTHRDIAEGIDAMWKEAGIRDGREISALVESIVSLAPPRYGSGW